MKKHWRIYLLLVLVCLMGSGILARLFSLQILQHDSYSIAAQNQQSIYQELLPKRGEIFLQDLNDKEKYYPLAINKEFKEVYIVPYNISDEEKDGLSDKLSSMLDLSKDVILERMNKKNDPYEPLMHKVGQDIFEKINELVSDGIGFSKEIWRYYPNNSLASHLVGFVGIDKERKIGQYGLESYYEKELKGKAGFFAGEKDTAGFSIPSVGQEKELAQDGANLILTIDQNVQFQAEKELGLAVEKWQALGGTIIIMDPKSGAIRAMANLPNFDPNNYSDVEDIDVFLNPSIQKVYEPGSVFKAFTMAAGLDSNKITPQDVYQDKGSININGSVIRNVDEKAYGEQTMTEILEKSLNTGAVFIQQKIGLDVFQDYVERFNFHKTTGIDLVGEVRGNISNLFTGIDIDLATISFGQGITVTPIGLITGFAAIANKGKLMRPFIVEKIIYPDGQEQIIEPEVIKQVISSETAKELSRMLTSVVDNGFGKPAKVLGYSIAGKTGTAQVPDSEKGGYSEETIHSFIGFAPSFDPEFVILIKLDEPQGIRFASDSISPIFKRLAEYMFSYLEIPPQ
ncbi:MAG: penicillin-binding protein 2 [bacterium]